MREKEQIEKNKEETVFIRGQKDNNENLLSTNICLRPFLLLHYYRFNSFSKYLIFYFFSLTKLQNEVLITSKFSTLLSNKEDSNA